MAYAYNEILIGDKEEMSELLSKRKAWRKLKCVLLGERSQCEQVDYCMISTIWHSKRLNYKDNIHRSDCQRFRWQGKR